VLHRRAELGQAVGCMCAAQAGRAGTVQLGRGGFSRVTANLFFYFLNIFKFLQIQKFV
jgi:hypothetical protein